MGQRSIALVFLVFFLGAPALIAEARFHESFSASSYYETNEKPVITSKESTDMSVDPNNRYPEGYPNTEHHYNPATEKYNEETLPKAKSEKDDLPTNTKPTGTETKVDPSGTIPKRYEAGYTNGHGTNPVSYSGSQTTDPLTFDPEKGRYQLGYRPYSSYSPKKTSPTTTTTSRESLSALNSNTQKNAEGDFMHRYEKGYYPESGYTQQGLVHQPKSVTSYSRYNGNFQSMPYPNSGVPFVASGAGCRTAYWAENPAVWPSFFTVRSTIGDAFGVKATSTFGQTTILQALLKYGSDPYNDLLRCGCTALLNSYTRGAYPVSHMKVIEQFNKALESKEAATAQALAFETDNVESISAGSACT